MATQLLDFGQKTILHYLSTRSINLILKITEFLDAYLDLLLVSFSSQDLTGKICPLIVGFGFLKTSLYGLQLRVGLLLGHLGSG